MEKQTEEQAYQRGSGKMSYREMCEKGLYCPNGWKVATHKNAKANKWRKLWI